MSKLLIVKAILALCPGWDTNHLGQTVTTDCQEYMVNCVYNKSLAPTESDFKSCEARLKSLKKMVPSDLVK